MAKTKRVIEVIDENTVRATFGTSEHRDAPKQYVTVTLDFEGVPMERRLYLQANSAIIDLQAVMRKDPKGIASYDGITYKVPAEAPKKTRTQDELDKAYRAVRKGTATEEQRAMVSEWLRSEGLVD